MVRNQQLLGRFSAANENKRIPSPIRCMEQLKQEQDQVKTLKELRERIIDETEKMEMHQIKEEFFEKSSQLINSRTFRNRDPDYTKHSAYEKLQVFDRTDKDLNLKITGKTPKQIELMFGIDTSAEVEKPQSRKTGRGQKDSGSHGGGGNSEKRHVGGLANKRIEAQTQKNKDI